MTAPGPDDQLQFLLDLVYENASIAGDVLQLEENLWAIHGYFPADGEVLMAEFTSYAQAKLALDALPLRTRRRDEF